MPGYLPSSDDEARMLTLSDEYAEVYVYCAEQVQSQPYEPVAHIYHYIAADINRKFTDGHRRKSTMYAVSILAACMVMHYYYY